MGERAAKKQPYVLESAEHATRHAADDAADDAAAKTAAAETVRRAENKAMVGFGFVRPTERSHARVYF